jgi:hypothetical protein
MQGEEEARPAGAAGPSAARVSRGGGVRAEPATVAGRGCGGGGPNGTGHHPGPGAPPPREARGASTQTRKRRNDETLCVTMVEVSLGEDDLVEAEHKFAD